MSARYETVALPVDEDGRAYITREAAAEDPALMRMIERQPDYWVRDWSREVWRGPSMETTK